MKEIILSYIEKWSAPFDPVRPIGYEQKYAEMERVAAELSNHDLVILLDILFIEKNDENYHSILMEFIRFYIRKHPDNSIPLIRKFEETKSTDIIELIGQTGDKELYPWLVKSINYYSLTIEGKLNFLSAIYFLNNKDALPFLNELIKNESRQDVVKEIQIVISRLGNV
jgi:hypothetical protein